jgi:ribose-phosphate pyrophosphokinase
MILRYRAVRWLTTAHILKEYGAKTVYACVSHVLLSEQGLSALEDSEIVELITTDSVENSLTLHHPKVKLISVAPLFAQAVKIIHNKDSLSQLFSEYDSI